MSTDILLLVLRVLSGAALMLFTSVLFFMLWRDYRIVSREMATRTRPRGRLVVLASGSSSLSTGAHLPLLPLTSLGRAPSNTILRDDSFASNQHAVVMLRSGQWWLEDVGSSNGTLLNGYRVEEPVVISSGDIIGLGQVELKLELD